jgi:hypothetical protein
MTLRTEYRLGDTVISDISCFIYAAPGSDSNLHHETPSGIIELCNHSQWRDLLRLPALALMGLAVAVFLRGLAYKVSLYQPHPTPSARASVPKVWAGPRRAASVAAVRVRAAAQPAGDLTFLQSQSTPVPHFNRLALRGSPLVIIQSGLCSLPSIPRSPPSPIL